MGMEERVTDDERVHVQGRGRDVMWSEWRSALRHGHTAWTHQRTKTGWRLSADTDLPPPSVSEGHGFLKRPNVYGAIPYEQLWHQLVVQELGRQFGPDQIEFVNGAKAATDSGYFEWCYPAHVGTDMDLVLIELAVNDDFSTDAFESTESLFRSLLSLPSQPAIILADAFALLTGRGKPLQLNGGDAHAHLAVRYDIPLISIRAAALTALMADPELAGPWFNHDARHIAEPFHRFLGDMVRAYLQKELCEVVAGGWEAERERWGTDAEHAPWPGMATLGQMPKNRITESWNSVAEHAVAPPTCRLAGPEGSEAELKPLRPTTDWELYSWRVSSSPLALARVPIPRPLTLTRSILRFAVLQVVHPNHRPQRRPHLVLGRGPAQLARRSRPRLPPLARVRPRQGPLRRRRPQGDRRRRLLDQHDQRRPDHGHRDGRQAGDA